MGTSHRAQRAWLGSGAVLDVPCHLSFTVAHSDGEAGESTIVLNVPCRALVVVVLLRSQGALLGELLLELFDLFSHDVALEGAAKGGVGKPGGDLSEGVGADVRVTLKNVESGLGG